MENPCSRSRWRPATATRLKWRLYGDDVLPLWVAEMDVLPPDRWSARVRTPWPRGHGVSVGARLVEALAGFAQRRWGWAPEPGTPASSPT